MNRLKSVDSGCSIIRSLDFYYKAITSRCTVSRFYLIRWNEVEPGRGTKDVSTSLDPIRYQEREGSTLIIYLARTY